MARVMVVEAEGPLDAVVGKAMDEFGFSGLRGKTVLIKPNMLGPFPPEKGATTRPEVVASLVRCVLQRGGRPVVGDNPGGMDTSPHETGVKAGMVAAAGEYFRNISVQVVEVPVKSRFVSRLVVSKTVMDADLVFNVPCFKTHLLTTLTGAVKNMFGMVPGGCKAKLHLAAPTRNRFAELLVDIYCLRPPDFHVLDGLLVMEGNGPTHGETRRLGKLVIGDDGVAVDAVAAVMAGLKPEEVRFLAAAAARGVGETDIARIDLVGRVAPIPGFRLPTGFRAPPEEQERALRSLGSMVPFLDTQKCMACGDCARNCPAGAITLDPHPRFARGRCISCFCCVELCREGALTVPGEVVSGLWDKIFA